MFEKMFELNNPYFKHTAVMFFINIVFLFVLIRLIYYRYSRKENSFFAFFLMGIIVFFIGSILNAVKLDYGMAIGLVAVLTIMRLRTSQISIKEMSYLFAVFGISVINSLRFVAFPLAGLLIINVVIILSAYVLEEYYKRLKLSALLSEPPKEKNDEDSCTITYKNLELLKPEKRSELVQDLANLTGMKVVRIKILKVSFEKNIADLEVYYRD